MGRVAYWLLLGAGVGSRGVGGCGKLGERQWDGTSFGSCTLWRGLGTTHARRVRDDWWASVLAVAMIADREGSVRSGPMTRLVLALLMVTSFMRVSISPAVRRQTLELCSILRERLEASAVHVATYE